MGGGFGLVACLIVLVLNIRFKVIEVNSVSLIYVSMFGGLNVGGDSELTAARRLLEACRAGDAKRVKQLLDSGCSPRHVRHTPPPKTCDIYLLID